MPKKVKYKAFLVEVFYLQNSFASFDFGSFAAVVYRDRHGEEKVSRYSQEYYSEGFMRYWSPRIISEPDQVVIPSNIFFRFQKMCDMRKSHRSQDLRDLIAEYFEKYIRAYSS